MPGEIGASFYFNSGGHTYGLDRAPVCVLWIRPCKRSQSGCAQAKAAGEAWVRALQTREYRSLSLLERVAMLKALVHLTLDGPTLRNTLEARLEESQRVRKQMWEDSRVSSLKCKIATAA